MAEKEIEKISEISRDDPMGSVDRYDQVERVVPNKEHFDQAIGTVDQRAPDVSRVNETKATLLEEIRNLNRTVDQAHKVTPERLAEQAKSLIVQIDDLKSKLETTKLDPNQIKGSVQRILRNKLDHIDESLKVAMDKAGLEYKPLDKIDLSISTPVERFISLLTNGQEQLNTLGGEVLKYHQNGRELSPASMLTVQIKVGQIQQEIEFFSSLLNKALESVKTIMNIQV
jgi:hypothetical protein